jgi:hypothetical protein
MSRRHRSRSTNTTHDKATAGKVLHQTERPSNHSYSCAIIVVTVFYSSSDLILNDPAWEVSLSLVKRARSTRFALALSIWNRALV